MLGICSHSVVITFYCGILHYHINDWNPNLADLVSETVPSAAGKKKSDRVSRKRRKPIDRNISTYTDGRPKASIPDDDKFHLVYISQTKSCCCGCKQRYRNSVTDILPPAPYDMVLARKLFRVFTPAGGIGLKISREKENAYVHLKRSCLMKCYYTINHEDIVVTQTSPPENTHILKLKDVFNFSMD